MQRAHQSVDLFDGSTLAGWSVVPRVYGSIWPGGPTVYDTNADLTEGLEEKAGRHPAAWVVEGGAIVGRQQPLGSGFGGYLLTDEAYADFELTLEMNPDWPADTGVMVRRRPDSWEGLQVLVDHRPNGSIGGFYGNGIGGFLAAPYTLDRTRRDGVTTFAVSNAPPWTPASAQKLTYAGDPHEFIAAWRHGDWNHLRIRCAGAVPRVTTWVNDVKVAEIDLSSLVAENYDADAVAARLGASGHIALEVHDNDPVLGLDRWGPDAACRWRNIRLTVL